MGLYIKDVAVDALAVRVQKLSGAKSKTEAVRNSLLAQEQIYLRKLPLSERMADIWAMVDSMGPSDPHVDMKAYMDELSGEVEE